jgi:hypothetical protein
MALAHELTHVVLADRFAGRQPPRWADEGIALLADSAEKQRLHERDCQCALRRGDAIPLVELLQLERCSSCAQVAAFYGQSRSLVAFLVRLGTPVQFVDFVERAMTQGHDSALRQTYGIESVAQLDRRWRESALSSQKPARPLRLGALDIAQAKPAAPAESLCHLEACGSAASLSATAKRSCILMYAPSATFRESLE